jgi:hypothetical protein
VKGDFNSLTTTTKRRRETSFNNKQQQQQRRRETSFNYANTMKVKEEKKKSFHKGNGQQPSLVGDTKELGNKVYTYGYRNQGDWYNKTTKLTRVMSMKKRQWSRALPKVVVESSSVSSSC